MMLASMKYDQSTYIFPTKHVLLFTQYRSSHQGIRVERKCDGKYKGTRNCRSEECN